MEHLAGQGVRKLRLGDTLLLVHGDFGNSVVAGVYGVCDVIFKFGVIHLFRHRIVVEVEHSAQEQHNNGIHPVHAELYLGLFLRAAPLWSR